MDTVTDYVAAGSFEDIRNNVTYLNEPGYAQLVRTVDLKKKFTNNDSVYVDESAFKYLWRVNLNDECIVLPNIGANIGEVYFVEPSGLPYDNNVLGPNAILLKANEDTYFAFTALNNLTFQKQLFENVGSSGQPKFNKTKLKSIQLYMPQNEEQVKIGQYFRQLDHLITLHQRKYLQEKKTSLTWEQRKLDDWGTFYYGKSCPKWSVTEDSTTPCIRYGELYTKFGAKIDRVYSYTNMSPENLRFSKGTEVLIPRVGEDPMDYNHCTWLSMPNVAIGEMISVFNTDNNPLFTAMMFNATLQNEFAMRVEGGSVTNLYFEKLKSIEVSFPSIPEQEKIAAYFDSIDHLITLHRRAHFHRRRRTYK